MSGGGSVLAPWLVLGSLFLTGTASAYCRTYTCDSTKTNCERDLNWCIVSGKPLTWPTSCIGWSVQTDGSKAQGISANRLEQIVQKAFDTWLSADCGGGLRPAIDIQNMGPVACAEAEYNQDHGNANIFMFRDEEWPSSQSEHALAVTTLWFNPNTGMIYDVDVEINGTMALAANDGDAGSDLQSIMTHEVGHFLGLSHSLLGESVMRTHYSGSMRVLHSDDIAGICSIYTPDRTVTTESCEPRHGFASTCRGSKEEGGCSFSAGGHRSGTAWLAALLLGTVSWRRRRARTGGPSDARR